MKRTTYGEIILTQDTDEITREQYKNALLLIKLAVEREELPKAFDTIEFDKKRRASGLALHHEIYDFNVDSVLICVRKTSGEGKYGVSTISKEYFIIDANSTNPANKHFAARYAKASSYLGEAIEMLKLKS